MSDREKYEKLLDIFNNFMCNVSAAFEGDDWELIKIAYDTAQFERQHFGMPLFKGGPNLEGDKAEVMAKRISSTSQLPDEKMLRQ